MLKSFGHSEEQMARTIVRNLVCKGVKLLAIDFDLTIVDIHTCGAWRGTTKKLAKHVRPSFRALIGAALEFEDIHVSIVTYSLQRDTIEDLLRFILPYSNTGNIIIQTSCKEWLAKNATPSGKNLGKEQHIAQVIADVYNFRRAVIHPHQILLMDDDEENVNSARHYGHHVFLVKSDVTLKDIYQFVERMSEPTIARSSSCGNLVDASCSVVPEAYRSSAIGLLVNQQAAVPNHSAQIYLTSQNHVPNRMLEMSEFNPQTASFTIPRPVVMNEQDRRNIPGEARMRRF